MIQEIGILKEWYNKSIGHTPIILYMTPEDLAYLREELDLPIEEDIQEFSDMKLVILPETELNMTHEDTTRSDTLLGVQRAEDSRRKSKLYNK